METEWKECEACAAKPGSPVLCRKCRDGRDDFYRRKNLRCQVLRHKSTKMMYDLVQMIEVLGASPAHTETVMYAEKIKEEIHDLLDIVEKVNGPLPEEKPLMTKVRLHTEDGCGVIYEGLTEFDPSKELPPFIAYMGITFKRSNITYSTPESKFVDYVKVRIKMIALHSIPK